MNCIKTLLPCFFTQNFDEQLDKSYPDNSYHTTNHTLQKNNKLIHDSKSISTKPQITITDIDKFNLIKYQKKGRTKEYYYDSKLIHKLELHEEYYIKVVDIYDADTITCILFYRDIPTIIKIRLQGIDTPEMKPNKNIDPHLYNQEKALAIIAKIVLQKIIDDNKSILYITTHGSEKYGRTLATLYKDNNKTSSLNQILVDLNLADSYQGQTKEKNFEKYYLNDTDSLFIIQLYENKEKYTIDELYNIIHQKFPIIINSI